MTEESMKKLDAIEDMIVSGIEYCVKRDDYDEAAKRVQLLHFVNTLSHQLKGDGHGQELGS